MAAHAPAPPTILAHKTAFLTAQTLQLSQPLAPSHAWQQHNDSAVGSNVAETLTPLAQKTLEDALFRLNHLIQQHSRRVYAPQASRHVAEQIERLLLDSAERYIAGRRGDNGSEGEDGAPGEEDALRIDADLTNDGIISSLPSTWAEVDSSQATAHQPEAQGYEDLASQLKALSSRRAEARQRVERLRRMDALLQPFSPTDGQDQAGVQKILVTRTGDIEKELERMRMLLVRVSGRLSQLPSPSQARSRGFGQDVQMADGDEDGDNVLDLDIAERNKVDALLGAF
ncbi:kinetochore complex Fta4 of Sim4 subunit, or CENP-50-domain-containing protein [Microdochium bolleyi]|uniref:Kinetochore complex Fta4 of Sim4 subunit, or CENP-50-domain-containing protein n=1 Tax=Microdochium bolleyi TaxID=196109 RepID=A0A136J4D7_9PEZI|nr:kinetochore complex Fta4 of Sim4 subunit, or CENP-50-domain-containing protein [Microdochium bolleyi]